MAAIPHDQELALAAFAVLLEKLPEPTVIADETGTVRFSNARGRERLNAGGARTAAEIRAAIRGPATGGEATCARLSVDGWYVVSFVDSAPSSRIARARDQYHLTPRQLEVVDLLVGGKTNETIATILGIATRTVEVHLSAIYDRVGVENRTALVSAVLAA